jgi:alkyl hydroperoxide reductase subunit AhpC
LVKSLLDARNVTILELSIDQEFSELKTENTLKQPSVTATKKSKVSRKKTQKLYECKVNIVGDKYFYSVKI